MTVLQNQYDAGGSGIQLTARRRKRRGSPIHRVAPTLYSAAQDLQTLRGLTGARPLLYFGGVYVTVHTTFRADSCPSVKRYV